MNGVETYDVAFGAVKTVSWSMWNLPPIVWGVEKLNKNEEVQKTSVPWRAGWQKDNDNNLIIIFSHNI